MPRRESENERIEIEAAPVSNLLSNRGKVSTANRSQNGVSCGNRKFLAIAGACAVILIFLVVLVFVLTRSDEQNLLDGKAEYDIGMIADQDGQSQVEDKNDEWVSYFLPGKLFLTYSKNETSDPTVDIKWVLSDRQALKTMLGKFDKKGHGSGAEFSELIKFDNRLITCDDKTGIVYEIQKVASEAEVESKFKWELKQWINLTDGGDTFKCEWGTVKDGMIWMGAQGFRREYNSIKKISSGGDVETLDWTGNYEKMKTALNIPPEGYLTHEAGVWSDHLQKWIIIPRKVSRQKFDLKADETLGSNKILIADANFDNIEIREIPGDFVPTHGVSSFKVIPLPQGAASNDSYIVALTTEELDDEVTGKSLKTFVLAFDLEGHTLFPETFIEDVKYEGIEFLRRK